jgi:hypothetical protein
MIGCVICQVGIDEIPLEILWFFRKEEERFGLVIRVVARVEVRDANSVGGLPNGGSRRLKL